VIKVDPTTSAIASGEAVLNDAVSIVVFESVLSLFYTHSNSRIVDFGSVPAQFVIVFFGSIIIGVAGGLASAVITKYLPLNINFSSNDSEEAVRKLMYPATSVINDGSSSQRWSPSCIEPEQGSHDDNRKYLEVGLTN
jgi:NhaP-type Na+/H+ or K+/H+ antiporter